ncbi:MAG TPA: hypothetical protein VGM73_14250 [Candidatus Didemnitutus sp.]
MFARLLYLFLGFVLIAFVGSGRVMAVSSAMSGEPAGFTSVLAAVAPAKAAHPRVGDSLLAKGPGFPDPASIGRTMEDNALDIALLVLALFGLWGLKRMMA